MFLRSLFPLLAICSLQAAEPAFDWLAFGGGVKNDKTRAITADSQGNVFLAGETTGAGTFGDQLRADLGSTDFFLTKVDSAGRVLWVRGLGGSLVDRGYGVVADAAGCAYVTGHYQSTDAQALGKTLANAGDYDIFVAKYDADGQLLWIQTAGGAGYDYGHGIALDSRGDVVVTGAIAGAGQFGDVAVNADSTARAIFWAKYSPEGKLRWVKTTTGKFSGSGHGIAIDAQDCLYIGGSGSGNGQAGALSLSTAGGQAALILKVSPDGEPLWAKLVPGQPSAGFHEISVDAQGHAVGAGMFKGSVTVAGQTFTTTGDKDNDGFVVHFTEQGEPDWVHALQGPGVDYCLGVAQSAEGQVYLTGEFSAEASFVGKKLLSQGATDIYVISFKPQGKPDWLTTFGGAKGDNAYTLFATPKALYLGGACAEGAPFGKKIMDSPAAAEAYGAKLSLP